MKGIKRNKIVNGIPYPPPANSRDHSGVIYLFAAFLVYVIERLLLPSKSKAI